MKLSSPTRPLSILVVDDVDEICELVQHWLAAAGHNVKCATSGNAARRLLETQRFDVVVTDVLMPDGDGVELIEACKAAEPTARIVAISGGGKYMDGGSCLKIARGFGADAAVPKPFTRQELMAAIDLACSRSDAATS